VTLLQERGRVIPSKPLKYAALNISAATTELVKGILVLYPEACIVPRVTLLEDEDISMEIELPLRMEAIYAARERIHELVIQFNTCAKIGQLARASVGS
jgi:hypothetical protein